MTTDHTDPMWARLDACLDARKDPLDDAELASWLGEDPARLLAFVEQRALLRELVAGPLERRVQRTPRRWPVGLAAAAVAAAALGLWFATQDAAVQQDDTPPSRIVAASLEERRPTFGVTAPVTARERLVISPTLTLETWSTETRMR